MPDDGDVRIPGRHVTELADFFAGHDRWLSGHACVRTPATGNDLTKGYAFAIYATW